MSDPDRLRLEMLFAQHAAAVRAYALRRIDPATAEETVSEVFLIAWRRLAELPDDPLPWLLACARRVLANQRRATRRRVALAERIAQAGGDERLVLDQPPLGDRALEVALTQLSEGDRELLLLSAWDRLDPEQLAATLGCSRRTLAVRLHRARRRLALALARAEREPSSTPATMEALG